MHSGIDTAKDRWSLADSLMLIKIEKDVGRESMQY